MTWTHVQSFPATALKTPGYFESRHEVTDGTEKRCEFLKWNHMPTVSERNTEVARILYRLNNPPPPEPAFRSVRNALTEIRDSAGTNAQKVQALADYIASIAGVE